MKRLLTLSLALCFTWVMLLAQESEVAKQHAKDSVLYSTTFYFANGNSEWIEKYEYVNVGRLLNWAQANEDATINIKGWSGSNENDYTPPRASLAFRRAKAIRSYLLQKGISAQRIIFEDKGIDSNVQSDKARRADVVAYLCVANKEMVETVEEIAEIADQVRNDEEEDQVCNDEVVETVEEIADQVRNDEVVDQVCNDEVVDQVRNDGVEETVETIYSTTTDSKSCFEWNYFTPRTNLLYWLGGMMNLGVEYKNPESNFGFLVNGGYSVFGDTEWNHNLGGWFVAPEVRYYFPSNDQWFVGAQFLAAGYNIKLSDIGKQGTVIGGGVMGGYKLTLSQTFDMDFTLGLGYGYFKYDTYTHDKASKTNQRIAEDIIKNKLLPIQAGVNLIWKIK